MNPQRSSSQLLNQKHKIMNFTVFQSSLSNLTKLISGSNPFQGFNQRSLTKKRFKYLAIFGKTKKFKKSSATVSQNPKNPLIHLFPWPPIHEFVLSSTPEPLTLPINFHILCIEIDLINFMDHWQHKMTTLPCLQNPIKFSANWFCSFENEY